LTRTDSDQAGRQHEPQTPAAGSASSPSAENGESSHSDAHGKKSRAIHWWDILAIVLLVTALGARGEPGSLWDAPKIAVVFAVMIALIRRGAGVGAVLILSAPVLGRLFNLSWRQLGSVMSFGVFQGQAHSLHEGGLKALGLGAVIFLVTLLGRLLVDSGVIRNFIAAMEDLLRDVRWIAAAVPAMLGLLPMPGGAMLSAPIVGELSDRLEMDAETKTLANYWFRHVWEYCWFLYPGLIAASTLVNDRDLWRLIAAHAPLSGAAIVLGVVAILLPMRRLRHAPRATTGKGRAIFWALWPVGVIVAVVAGFGSRVSGAWRLCLMSAVSLVVVVVFAFARRMKLRDFVVAARRTVSLEIALLVLGIYFMQGMFETSGAADNLPAQLAMLGIPTAIILFFVPMTVGLLTGITVAAVATTFPLLLGLIDSSARNIMLAYAGGFMGVLLSPVHLCLVLTRDYFRASFRIVYRRLLVYVGIMSAFAYALYAVYGLST